MPGNRAVQARRLEALRNYSMRSRVPLSADLSVQFSLRIVQTAVSLSFMQTSLALLSEVIHCRWQTASTTLAATTQARHNQKM